MALQYTPGGTAVTSREFDKSPEGKLAEQERQQAVREVYGTADPSNGTPEQDAAYKQKRNEIMEKRNSEMETRKQQEATQEKATEQGAQAEPPAAGNPGKATARPEDVKAASTPPQSQSGQKQAVADGGKGIGSWIKAKF